MLITGWLEPLLDQIAENLIKVAIFESDGMDDSGFIVPHNSAVTWNL